MLKLLVPAILLLLAVIATVATDDPARPADLTLINRGDVATLDLQRMSWMQDLRVGRAIFEGLVRNDIFTPDYTISPGVAERWEISPDGKTYTFHLRDNAKWSNGSAVTAGHFVYSWRRALLPDTASDYTALFQLIEGGKEFFDWRTFQLLRIDLGRNGLPPDASADAISKALDVLRVGVEEGSIAPALFDSLKAMADARYGEATKLISDALKRMGPGDVGGVWSRTLDHFDKTVALKAVDDRTFTFTLVRPTPFFMDLCAFAVFYPVYPPLLSQYERPDPQTGRIALQTGWTKAGTIITNGPFKLVKWRFKRDMRMERNEHYWDPKRINLDSIQIVSMEDPNSQVLAFRSGVVDWVSDVSAPYRADILAAKREFYREHQTQVDELQAQGLDPIEIDAKLPADPRNRIVTCPAFGTYFYNFNCLPKLPDGRDNPFADRRVRKAFALAVDKHRIVDQVRRVGEKAVGTLVPVGSIGGYESPKGLGYDPEAARRLLAEAGYPRGRGLPTIDILYTKDGGHEFIAQSIKKDWEEVLGVSVSLQQREIKVFRNDLKKQNYMVSRGGWFGDYGDPTTFLDLNRKDDGNNDRKYNSPAFEALMTRADNEPDAAKRLAILTEAERLIIEEDLPVLPLFQYVQLYLFDPHRLTGISSHPRQEQSIHEMDMLGDGKGADKLKVLPPVKPSSQPQRLRDTESEPEKKAGSKPLSWLYSGSISVSLCLCGKGICGSEAAS